MTVRTHLMIFTIVVGRIGRVAHSDGVRCLTEVVAEKPVAGLCQRRVFRLQGLRLMLPSFEPCKLGHLCGIAVEAGEVPNLCENAPGKDRPKARYGVQRVREGRHALGDSGVEPLDLAFETGL